MAIRDITGCNSMNQKHQLSLLLGLMMMALVFIDFVPSSTLWELSIMDGIEARIKSAQLLLTAFMATLAAVLLKNWPVQTACCTLIAINVFFSILAHFLGLVSFAYLLAFQSWLFHAALAINTVVDTTFLIMLWLVLRWILAHFKLWRIQ
jgi:hypothetical protein